jgi:alpha-1,6-mannosyltransferase
MQDAAPGDVAVQFGEKSFTIDFPTGRSSSYCFDLFAAIVQSDCSVEISSRGIKIILSKQLTHETWPSLQMPGKRKPPTESRDWDTFHYSSSDEDSNDDGDVGPPTDASEGVEVQIESADLPLWAKIGPILLVFGIALMYLVIAPYTKVEESFHLQAVHDLWHWGSDLPRYDHLQFPGVVPRSFIPDIIWMVVSYPLLVATPLLSSPSTVPLLSLVAVRLSLLLLWLGTFIFFSVSAKRAFSQTISPSAGGRIYVYLCLLTASQFHLLFYASRSLPNTFAVMGCHLAFGFLFRQAYVTALAILIVSMMTLRCEMVLILGLILGWSRLVGRHESQPGRWLGILTATWAIAASVSLVIDSFFWQQPWLIPEWAVLYFNTIRNGSVAYGTAPVYWYGLSGLPKALLIAFPLAIPSIVVGVQRLLIFHSASSSSSSSQHVREEASNLILSWLTLVACGLTAAFSLLPHKEIRFLFPILPCFNVLAAASIVRWESSTDGPAEFTFFSRLQQAISSLVPAAIVVCAALSISFALSSAAVNYPGGEALTYLSVSSSSHGSYPLHCQRVHVDAAAASNGISLWLNPSHLAISKEEGITDVDRWKEFDFLIHAVPQGSERPADFVSVRAWQASDARTPEIALLVHKRCLPSDS